MRTSMQERTPSTRAAMKTPFDGGVRVPSDYMEEGTSVGVLGPTEEGGTSPKNGIHYKAHNNGNHSLLKWNHVHHNSH